MTHSARLLPGIPLIESPLLEAILAENDFSEAERAIARAIAEQGFAVIDFPDSDLDARIERIKAHLAPGFGLNPAAPHAIAGETRGRVQDAWKDDADVRAIAANSAILSLLERLWGRRAIPFQTLNFPVGTEQALHSDAVHFSSLPERFMAGVWVALEDIDEQSGALTYCPGSHRWPMLGNAVIGRRGWGSTLPSAQSPFEAPWQAMVAASGAPVRHFSARKGQALIWAANLLHGGGPRIDRTRSRWSQVTHYYFADCIYYTPAYSDEAIGRLALRQVTNIATGASEPSLLNGEEVTDDSLHLAPGPGPRWRKWLPRPRKRR